MVCVLPSLRNASREMRWKKGITHTAATSFYFHFLHLYCSITLELMASSTTKLAVKCICEVSHFEISPLLEWTSTY